MKRNSISSGVFVDSHDFLSINVPASHKVPHQIESEPDVPTGDMVDELMQVILFSK
jgi:hypothetical protein